VQLKHIAKTGSFWLPELISNSDISTVAQAVSGVIT